MSRNVEHIMAAEAAALLLMWLEMRGAIVTLTADECVHVDVGPIHEFGRMTPGKVRTAVCALDDELRALLRARRTVH